MSNNDSEHSNNGSRNMAVVWLGALLVTLLAFYGLDHFIMGIQGLPLNLNLTPTQ